MCLPKKTILTKAQILHRPITKQNIKFTVNMILHHCRRVNSQNVGVTGDRELKQKDAHSKFQKNKQILL